MPLSNVTATPTCSLARRSAAVAAVPNQIQEEASA